MSEANAAIGLISQKRVLELVPVSKTQLYRMMNAGQFPSQITVGKGRIAYDLSEVLAWIEQRKQTRGEGGEMRRERAVHAVAARNSDSRKLSDISISTDPRVNVLLQLVEEAGE